jgi:hypothetical protein
VEIVESERGDLKGFEVAVAGETTGTDSDSDKAKIESWAQVGATWWLEDINGMRAEINDLRDRIRRGPPAM